MKKLLPVALVGSIVALLVIACTGEDPEAASGPERGSLGAECQANGACNAGLSCTLVDGKARCANAATADASASDAGSTDDGGERPRCPFSATPSECKDEVRCHAPTADAGDGGANCIAPTGDCAADLLRWECNSPHYGCGSCCITADLVNPPGCSEATLKLAGKNGTSCIVETSCPLNRVQLCQANGQCPADQYCKPAKIQGAYTVNGSIFGVCVR